MDDYVAATFGVLNAAHHDAEHDPGTTDETVEFLYPWASAGKTLELAIGTGRIALPLHLRGCEVYGIDASQAMLDGLAAKQQGQEIPVTVADMAAFQLPHQFHFAYLVFNTLFNLTSQADQVACFKNTAQHLEPGGYFLIETLIPDLSWFQNGQYVRTRDVTVDSVMLEAATHDPLTQVIEFQLRHGRLRRGDTRTIEVPDC